MGTDFVTTLFRAATAFTFLISAVAKLADYPTFRRSLEGLKVVPPRFVGAVSVVVILSELLALALLVVGRMWLSLGFGLAAFLFVVFAAVLASVLARGLAVPCGCFGGSMDPISTYDLVRNVGLCLAALAGGLASSARGSPALSGAAMIHVQASLMGFVLALVLINVKEVTRAIIGRNRAYRRQ